VFGNLLDNAAKYTDQGGHIRLEAAVEGGEAVVRVRDDGIGLAPELLPHVFDLFTQADSTLDRSRGGLGIGLTLVRQLVELHGGRVEASSDGPGRGSEFAVRLPTLARGAAPAGDLESGGPDADRGSAGLRILVVEDNADAAETLRQVLELSGHRARTVLDGPAALEAVGTFAPDVVLCNIGLPGMSGYEVAERLRRTDTGRRIPLIALTGYGHLEARSRTREAGFDHHLVKPVEPDALSALLTALAGAKRPPAATARWTRLSGTAPARSGRATPRRRPAAPGRPRAGRRRRRGRAGRR
jgi:CheY-like chemotaxis protein